MLSPHVLAQQLPALELLTADGAGSIGRIRKLKMIDVILLQVMEGFLFVTRRESAVCALPAITAKMVRYLSLIHI